MLPCSSLCLRQGYFRYMLGKCQTNSWYWAGVGFYVWDVGESTCRLRFHRAKPPSDFGVVVSRLGGRFCERFGRPCGAVVLRLLWSPWLTPMGYVGGWDCARLGGGLLGLPGVYSRRA